MYQEFAEIYDELMNDVNYESWADYYTRLLSVYGIHNGHLCECACGTGNLTLAMERRGFSMTGADISREMLWQAAQKSRKRGLTIPFVQQDMRSLNLHRPVDAVLATCDGVNYLLTDEDLTSFFRAAYRSIRPGGALIFDISTPHKLRDILCAGLMCDDRESITYLWGNTWHASRRTVDLDLCFFLKEPDGRYRRMEEHQTQRAWSQQELKDGLWKAGFRTVSLYSNMTLRPATEEDQRWHIAATRPEPEE
ncbi:MAG: class I SAM-dependent methyltransferase [Clostridiales bacterium]|nr:class I SAM-dependent methyltransferase [Clostridiales bacterium]